MIKPTCKHCGFEIDDQDYCAECGMIAPDRRAEMEKTVMLMDVAATEFTLVARGKKTNQENWENFWSQAPQESDEWWAKYAEHRFLILEDKYGVDLADKYLDEEADNLSG